MAPRLKVFTWSDGFHAFTVAASSRPKALQAWGSNQDLFSTGLAREIGNGPDYDAALASPGDVIRRGLAIDIGEVTKDPAPAKAGAPSKSRRDEIKRLKDRLEALDAAHADVLAQMNETFAALQARRERITKDHEHQRSQITAALKEARASR